MNVYVEFKFYLNAFNMAPFLLNVQFMSDCWDFPICVLLTGMYLQMHVKRMFLPDVYYPVTRSFSCCDHECFSNIKNKVYLKYLSFCSGVPTILRFRRQSHIQSQYAFSKGKVLLCALTIFVVLTVLECVTLFSSLNSGFNT